MSESRPSVRNELAVPCVYFKESGKVNTRRTLEIAAQRARELDVDQVLLATTAGETGLQALDFFPGEILVIVTHSTGFVRPGAQQLSPEVRRKLEGAGAQVLTCQHALGGINRAVRRKLNTYQLDEIIAYTLRIFGQGTKVAVETALMAADAGKLSTARPCISIGGTSEGADTALLLKAAHAQDFFDLRIMEFLAKPHLPT
ncbi:MAG: hypothetical protein WBB73_05615 [Candidatus Aminicenantaceae bacterium]|jgi:hypothetical protein